MTSPPPPQSPTRSRYPIGGATGSDGSHEPDDSPNLNPSNPIDKNDKQWDTRAPDEAQFEAVLEAERRRASRA